MLADDPDTTNISHAAPARRLNGYPVINLLLATIPQREFEAMLPHLEYQELPAFRVLGEPDQPVVSAYFLNSGFASVEIPSSEGASVEVGSVGKGGFVGVPLLCGIRKTLLRTVVHIRGAGFRVNAEVLERVIHAAPQFHLKMRRYALLQGMQMAQIAGCNRFHRLGQRLARWLLGAADRIGLEVPVTQEHLAQILGTGRASLSVAASSLRRRGAIEYSRGTVRIRNRPELEQFSCECYENVRRFRVELGLSW